MKQFKNLLFISSILLCWVLVSCKTSKTSSGWSLVWEENFNQKKGFDPQVWSKIPRGKADWNNYMTDFDSCFAMRKGKLVLRGIANQTQRNDTAPYLTGGVYTKGKKAFYERTHRDMCQAECRERSMAGYLAAARKMPNGRPAVR